MPVEIKELHIRVSLDNSVSNTPNSGTGTSAPSKEVSYNDKAAIVAECIEQIMQILKEKTER